MRKFMTGLSIRTFTKWEVLLLDKKNSNLLYLCLCELISKCMHTLDPWILKFDDEATLSSH